MLLSMIFVPEKFLLPEDAAGHWKWNLSRYEIINRNSAVDYLLSFDNINVYTNFTVWSSIS